MSACERCAEREAVERAEERLNGHGGHLALARLGLEDPHLPAVRRPRPAHARVDPRVTALRQTANLLEPGRPFTAPTAAENAHFNENLAFFGVERRRVSGSAVRRVAELVDECADVPSLTGAERDTLNEVLDSLGWRRDALTLDMRQRCAAYLRAKAADLVEGLHG